MRTITKTYRAGWPYSFYRTKAEEKLFKLGYKITSEEEYTERDWANTCCLAFIFLPLVIFFGKITKQKVTYAIYEN